MFQQMKKRIKNQKGLTLIELLAVIVILAIISAIAVPAIGNIIDNTRDKAILSEAMNVISGAKIAHTEGLCENGTCDSEVLADFVDGVTLADGDKVVFSEDDRTITYGRFGDLTEDGNFTGVGESITEEELKTALENGKLEAAAS